MKEQWMVYGKKADFKEIGKRFGIAQVTARIMRNRGVEGDAAIGAVPSREPERLPFPFLIKRHGSDRGDPCEKAPGGKTDPGHRRL